MAFSYSQLVSIEIVMSVVNKSPLCTVNTLGALTGPIFITIDDAASFSYTAQTMDSIPCRLPWLSYIGTLQMMRKDAIGEMFAYSLLLGVMYGSAGDTITELAVIVGGG
jgi:hypothetical protein